MDANEATLRAYWKALAAADGEGMARCYAPDATFHDPVFQVKGPEVPAMWRMLMTPPKGGPGEAKVTTGPLSYSAGEGDGKWEAVYNFSMTGRRVHNKIHSHFHLRDGKIVEQVDSFDFWRWSRMALGVKGGLLGWTPFVRKAVQRKARARLARSMG